MQPPFVPDPDNIRLAMLGMVEGNGHPYSWSAIINGRYDQKVIADCGYPVIGEYLGAQSPEKPRHQGRFGHARLVRSNRSGQASRGRGVHSKRG